MIYRNLSIVPRRNKKLKQYNIFWQKISFEKELLYVNEIFIGLCIKGDNLKKNFKCYLNRISPQIMV